MDAFDIPRLRGLTHAYAFWAALVATAFLVFFTPSGAPRAAALIYGAGLCALFGGSGLYHRWRWNPRWKTVLRRVDHSTIFLFIAAWFTRRRTVFQRGVQDRKSTRLNSSHPSISYAVFCF